jgi:hypothetical protein
LWGPASTSCGRWLSKNLTGISPPVNADIPTDIQVHFVDEFDAHASPTGARGMDELCATGVAAAVAYDAVRVNGSLKLTHFWSAPFGANNIRRRFCLPCAAWHNSEGGIAGLMPISRSSSRPKSSSRSLSTSLRRKVIRSTGRTRSADMGVTEITKS